MGYTVLEQIKIRLRQYKVNKLTEDIDFTNTEEDVFLEQLISEAEEEIKRIRNYPSDFTEEKIQADMKQFEKIIIRLVIYDYNKEGVEFESQDSENGYLRTFVTRDKLLNQIYPFVHVL